MKQKWSKRVALFLTAATILSGMPTEYLYAEEITEMSDMVSDTKAGEAISADVSTETENIEEDTEQSALMTEETTENENNLENEIGTASTEEVQETDEYKEADELLNYLVLDNAYIELGNSQNVIVDIGDGTSEITGGKLLYHKESDGITLEADALEVNNGGLRFNMSFTDTSTIGKYILDAVIYIKNEQQYKINLADTGMDVKFGVNTQVDTNPDAEVINEEPEDIDVVSFDENGNQISEDSIASAIENQKQEQQGTAKATYGSNGTVTVVLDPGHDGSHGGTNDNGVAESLVNLKIAQYCKEELSKYHGVTVYMTRDSQNCPYGGGSVNAATCNEKRVAYAKSVGANVYVSIHNNWTSSSSASGVEIYYPNQNYKPSISQSGQELASHILNQLVALGLKNRGTKVRTCVDHEEKYQYADGTQADYYAVIRNCKKEDIPAIIIEHAFISNASDVANFLSNDTQLQKLGVADATGIAQYFGLQTMDYSAVFNASYYAEHNQDIKAAFGTDENALLNHFINYGMKEGRRASAEFDVLAYKARYGDLRALYGNDLPAYYMHYINYGKKEGRIGINPDEQVTVYNGIDYSAVYNYQYYIAANSDVAATFGADSSKVLAHFVNYGMAEGRRASADFDVTSYRNAYRDLRAAYGNNLPAYYMHYINYGKTEGRKATGVTTLQNAVTSYNGVDYSAVYDYNYYLAQNPDVSGTLGTDENTVLAHFVNYGMAEGRCASATFDVASYRNAYRDLRAAYGNNLPAYYMHYINYGKKEGRRATGVTTLQNAVTSYNGMDYSSVYDYNYYLSNNADVAAALGTDENVVIAHFVNYGMKEGRRANINFNVAIYKANYGDLRTAYGDNLPAYYMHYINYGMKEGRNAQNELEPQQQLHSIMGGTTTSIEQMVNFFNAKGSYDSFYANSDAPTLNDFCRMYQEESIAEGVDPAVAFCQAMKETGFLRYGGDVERSQYNFAGLGATGNGAKGNSFATVREGIRAQIQHLKAYASTETLNNPCVDSRFKYVTRGCAPYVEWLGISENPSGKGWATAKNYGYSIVNDYMSNLYKY